MMFSANDVHIEEKKFFFFSIDAESGIKKQKDADNVAKPFSHSKEDLMGGYL